MTFSSKDWKEEILEREGFKKRDMNTENIYQIIDDLEAFAEKVGSEWMKERLAMLEVHIINQSSK